jgi:hypothetical protein
MKNSYISHLDSSYKYLESVSFSIASLNFYCTVVAFSCIDMTAATAYCTSNPILCQTQSNTRKSQSTAVLPFETSSTSSSTMEYNEQYTRPTQTIHNDENNNQSQLVRITDNYDTNGSASDDNDSKILDSLNMEDFLRFVGLRNRTKKRTKHDRTVRPLTKRLAAPICLLPLQNNSDRVRRALYLVLPYLKFLSITYDFENFCSTDDIVRVQRLLSRSATHARNPPPSLKKKHAKNRLSKAGKYG